MKTETLEEATTKYLRTLKGVNYRSIYDFSNQQTLAFMYGAKWQQETYNQFTLAMDDLKSSRECYLKAKEEYEFAIGFAEWLFNESKSDIKELLEIYKKEKGL